MLFNLQRSKNKTRARKDTRSQNKIQYTSIQYTKREIGKTDFKLATHTLPLYIIYTSIHVHPPITFKKMEDEAFKTWRIKQCDAFKSEKK